MLALGGAAGDAFLKIFRDRTDERQAEERRQMLVAELNHRVKNTLAIVRAMARQSLRGTAELEDATARFEQRLEALADAHDVLTRERWAGADIREIVEGALAPFETSVEGAVELAGPPFLLTPRAALALAMVLHELATNAVKYGPLSLSGGVVEVTWTLDDPGPDQRFGLLWRERGGPPVTAPTRRGFGSRLIERSLAAEFGATARIDFAPEGLVCVIDTPAARVRAD
jgi:two-component sensor histidine kinase